MMHLAKKAFYKLIGLNPYLDRWIRYRNPRKYWSERGGDRYFIEQESVQARTLRSEFITDHLRQYPAQSILEVGSGYGKQLKNLAREGLLLAGCDFSRPQLLKSRDHCQGIELCLAEADAEHIPFASQSMDLVFSSAVILHNRYPKAQGIIAEMIRVSRRWIAHNEDTDVTFSRYGYDMKKTYEKLNFKIHESIQIPCANQPSITQFTVVELPSPGIQIAPKDIPLQYH